MRCAGYFNWHPAFPPSAVIITPIIGGVRCAPERLVRHHYGPAAGLIVVVLGAVQSLGEAMRWRFTLYRSGYCGCQRFSNPYGGFKRGG